MRDEVLVRLTPDERDALLCEEGGPGFSVAVRDLKRGVLLKLRSALTEEVEERVEYRLVGDFDGPRVLSWPSPCFHLPAAESYVREQEQAGWTNVRIQQRTISTFKDGGFYSSPWVDLEEGGA